MSRTSYLSNRMPCSIPGAPIGIPGTVRPMASGFSSIKALNVGARNMPLDKVAVDLGRVTASKLVGNARILSHTVEQGCVSGIHLYIEAIGLKVLNPVAAALTRRGLPDFNGRVGRESGRTEQKGEGE